MTLRLTKILPAMAMLTMFFSVSHTFANKDPMVERTWNEGTVYAPGNILPRTVKNFKPKQKYPVVLYFHGCGGISTTNDVPWAKLLSSNGYLVVMPDSFARPNKKVECDPRTRKRASSAEAWLRVDEIVYSLKKIKEAGWADGAIFLMGHSQGAAALSAYPVTDVNGVILSSLVSCGLGTNIPRSTKVFRIGYSNDPWNNFSPAECDAHMIHENFLMKIIDGREHETYFSNEFKKDVLDFLSAHKN